VDLIREFRCSTRCGSDIETVCGTVDETKSKRKGRVGDCLSPLELVGEQPLPTHGVIQLAESIQGSAAGGAWLEKMTMCGTDRLPQADWIRDRGRWDDRSFMLPKCSCIQQRCSELSELTLTLLETARGDVDRERGSNK